MPSYIVKMPSHSTKQRMKEVHFWLIMQILYLKRYRRKIVPHEYHLYVDSMIESMCMLFQIKSSVIKYAISKINHVMFKPTDIELALASRYLNFTIRELMSVARISNRKIYHSLETYIKNGSMDVEPHFDQDVYLELEKFNRAFHIMFDNSHAISKLDPTIYTQESEFE